MMKSALTIAAALMAEGRSGGGAVEARESLETDAALGDVDGFADDAEKAIADGSLDPDTVQAIADGVGEQFSEAVGLDEMARQMDGTSRLVGGPGGYDPDAEEFAQEATEDDSDGD